MRRPTMRRFALPTVRKLLATTLVAVAVTAIASPASQTGAWFTDAKSLTDNSVTSAKLGAPENLSNASNSSTGNTLSWDSATSQSWATANNVTSGITYRVTRHVGSYPAEDLYSGSATSFTDPPPASRNLRYTQVSAGQQHTLAIDENGSVWAWGYNGKGAFGDGTTTSTDTPQKTLLPDGRTAVQIATGNMWSAALLDDGTLWTWGYNVGNLGIGNTTNQRYPQRVKFPSGVRVQSLGQILGDSKSMFVIDENDAIWSWGNNDEGQLGDGSVEFTTTPHVIPKLRVRSVSSMDSHVIALGTDGRVWSWGNDSDGQVGDHGSDRRLNPYRLSLPSAVSNVTQVSSGGTYSALLDENGAIWMWGAVNVNGSAKPQDPTRIRTPRLPSGVQAEWVATGPKSATASPYYFIPSVLVRLTDGTMLQYEINDEKGALHYNDILDGHFITFLAVGGAQRVAITANESNSGLYFWTLSDTGKQSSAKVVRSPVICPDAAKLSGSSCVWDGVLSYTVDYQYGPWRSEFSSLTP